MLGGNLGSLLYGDISVMDCSFPMKMRSDYCASGRRPIIGQTNYQNDGMTILHSQGNTKRQSAHIARCLVSKF